MNKEYSFDRREGDVAVLVDNQGNSHPISLTSLPTDAREGCMLRKTETGYVVDVAATGARRQRVLELQRHLRK